MAESEPTAAQIREIAETVSGLKTVGVVEQVRHPKGRAAYRLRVAGGILLVTPRGDGWTVSMGNEQEVFGYWDVVPNEATDSGGRLIDLILQLDGAERAVFQRTFVQLDGIHRKHYTTGQGPVWLHSRPNERGTEGALQFVDGTILRYQWERATGGIDFDQVERVDELPF